MLQTYQCMLLGVCGTRTEPSLQFLNIQEREMNDSADALCVCYLLTLWHTNYAAESTKGMSDDQCAGKVQPECSVCCRCLQSFTRKVLGACTTAAYPSTARLCQSCLGYSYGPYLRTLLQTLVLIISTSSSIENHLPTTLPITTTGPPFLAYHNFAQQLPTWPAVLPTMGCKAGPGPRPASWKRLGIPQTAKRPAH